MYTIPPAEDIRRKITHVSVIQMKGMEGDYTAPDKTYENSTTASANISLPTVSKN